MTALHVTALAAVAVTGTAVVLMRDPLKQLVVAGFFGLALALLFFVFGAPDVALSQIVVATVAVPLLALLTLVRMRERQDSE
jgi:energy-converting hydrogenase B subunit D